MNKKTFLEISEISDSREVLAEKPQRFSAIFGYILLAMLVIAIAWMCIGEIDYYVKARGEVRPAETVSTVRSIQPGRVALSNLEEGKDVAAGELLFALDTKSLDATEQTLTAKYDDFKQEIANMELLEQSVLAGKNLFNVDDPKQTSYYNKYEKYLTDAQVAIEQIRNTNLEYNRVTADAEATYSANQAEIARIQKSINALELLIKSIDTGENLVPAVNADLYGRYVDFKYKIQQYDALVTQREGAYERLQKLLEVGGASQREVENAKSELDAAKLERDSYKNEVRTSAASSITELSANLNQLRANSAGASAIINSEGKGYSEDLHLDKSKYDMLSAISEALFTMKNNLTAIENDLENVRRSISESNIAAPISGTLNLYTEVSVGDFVQSGTQVATIVPASGGGVRVLIAVPNSDVASIKEGQQVYFRFDALPYGEYGEVKGIVISVSSDARQDQASGRSYYVVEGRVDEAVLHNEKGDEGEIMVGMTAEVRVVTKTRKIIYWLLEKMDFID